MAMLLVARGARRVALARRPLPLPGVGRAVYCSPIQYAMLATSTSEPKNLYEKGKETLTKFAKGVKEICSDGKESFFAYQKLMSESLRAPKEEKAGGQGPVYLRVRRQYRLLRETMSGLTKLFPLIVLWLPPGIGLIPPILFIYFPRQIFTRHFWTEEEREEFARIHYQEKAAHYPALRKQVLALVRDDPGTAGHADEGWAADGSLRLAALREKEVVFNEDHRGGVDSLGDPHLRLLAKAAQVNKFVWLIDHVPTGYLRWSLRRRATEVFIDDMMLRASGTDELTVQELRDACDLRGLPALGASKQEMLRAQLQLWLSIYDYPGKGDDAPSSSSEQKAEEVALVAKHYWIWWPGHGNSKEALADLLAAARKRSGRTDKKDDGDDQRIWVPPPSLLLHMPALQDPSEVQAKVEPAGRS